MAFSNVHHSAADRAFVKSHERVLLAPAHVDWKRDALSGNVVGAIRLLRHDESFGLREAKLMVEEYISHPHRYDNTPQRTSILLANGGRLEVVHEADGTYSVSVTREYGHRVSLERMLQLVAGASADAVGNGDGQ